MPTSTIKFRFEELIFQFGSEHSLAHAETPEALVLQVDDHGNVLPTRFRSREAVSRHLSNREVLLPEGQLPKRYVFFDPFDWPEYAWVEWAGIDLATMERITGNAFEESDFRSSLGERIDYPETWSFMC